MYFIPINLVAYTRVYVSLKTPYELTCSPPTHTHKVLYSLTFFKKKRKEKRKTEKRKVIAVGLYKALLAFCSLFSRSHFIKVTDSRARVLNDISLFYSRCKVWCLLSVVRVSFSRESTINSRLRAFKLASLTHQTGKTSQMAK